MKEPKLNSLKFTQDETDKIRTSMKRTKKVKITINVDAESLAQLKKISSSSGVPYQRLLNGFLKEAIGKKRNSESRLDKIEKDLEEIKKKLAA